MYRWSIILVVVLGALLPIPFQSDFWPFSTYSMFNSNLSNSKLKEQRDLQLVGFSRENGTVPINQHLITGAYHPGMISVALNSLLQNENGTCVRDLMGYWAARYVSAESRLTSRFQNLEKLFVMETRSGERESTILFETVIDGKD